MMDRQDEQFAQTMERARELLDRSPRRNLYGPNRFWADLCAQHENIMREQGFRSFKRTINGHYHQWWVDGIADSKIRRLVWELVKRGRFPVGFFQARLLPERENPELPRNARLYAAFVGLLWQYALLEDRLGCLDVCEEPTLGGPFPISYGRRHISQDLATSSLEVNRIFRHVPPQAVSRVAEIGAGYGRLAYVMLSRWPGIQHFIFDIPPTLAISQTYLTGVLGESAVRPLSDHEAQADALERSAGFRVAFHLPHHLESWPDRSLDLFLSVSTFDELQADQIANYIALIDRTCKGWVYMKGRDCPATLHGVPVGGIEAISYPPRWRPVYSGRDPYSPRFVEKIFSLTAS